MCPVCDTTYLVCETCRGMGMKAIEIVVDWVPPGSMRANAAGEHRAKKYTTKASMRESGWAYGREAMARYEQWAAIGGPVGIDIYVRNPRHLDLDNIALGYKSFIDGIVSSGLLLDDSSAVVTSYSVHWEGKGEPRSRVIIQGQ